MSKDVKQMSLEEADSFTSDQVTSAIKSCRNSKAYSTDSFSIPISKLDKDSSQDTSYRSISLLCPAAKVLEALMLLLSTHTSMLICSCPSIH